MKLPFFKVAFKNQWVSMTIYSSVIVLYGLLIMLAYMSMVAGSVNDPSTTNEGLTLTNIGKDDNGNEVLNLTWETEAGISYHMVVGIRNLTSMETLMDPLVVKGLRDGTLDISELPGLELIYNGTGTFIEFPNRNGSMIFAVLLVPTSGDMADSGLRGPVYAKDLMRSSDFDALLKDNPMMKAFFGERVIDYTTVEGYLMVEYFSMWPLFFVIYIAVKSSSAVSKHVEDHSIDILLATGYSRNRFLAEKVLLMALNMAILIVSALLGIFLGALMIGKAPPLTGSIYALLGSIPMCLAFVGISFVITVLVDEGGKAVGAILGFIIFQYILQIVANIASWGSTLKYFSLFSYWDSLELGIDHQVSGLDMLVPTAIGIGLIVLSFIIFNRKEIHA